MLNYELPIRRSADRFESCEGDIAQSQSAQDRYTNYLRNVQGAVDRREIEERCDAVLRVLRQRGFLELYDGVIQKLNSASRPLDLEQRD
jgi:hypothetical protein